MAMADLTRDPHRPGPGEGSTPENGFVVVGVDGSASSVTALRWAIVHAAWTGARVEAVTAWQEPSTYGLAFGYSPAWPGGLEVSGVAAKSLAETVAAVLAPMREPPVVTTRVVQGHPGQVLTDAARGARLLVVGRRGHGALVDLLLGSVSHHCVQYAACPVVVIPDDGGAEQR
jgi:nucleotide-binding universal stress UspA family protein